MDAIIGRYKVSLEETGLILKHPAGISFELTVEETRRLGDFIDLYRQTLLVLQEEMDRQTDPRIKAIIFNNEEED